MTCRTFDRTCPALFVAAFAIGVQGIAPFGVAVRAMAILTTTRAGAVFLFFVMAIIARKAIPCVGSMGFVIKQDLSSSALQHESYRFFRFFLRKGGIAYNAYNE